MMRVAHCLARLKSLATLLMSAMCNTMHMAQVLALTSFQLPRSLPYRVTQPVNSLMSVLWYYSTRQ